MTKNILVVLGTALLSVSLVGCTKEVEEKQVEKTVYYSVEEASQYYLYNDSAIKDNGKSVDLKTMETTMKVIDGKNIVYVTAYDNNGKPVVIDSFNYNDVVTEMNQAE